MAQRRLLFSGIAVLGGVATLGAVLAAIVALPAGDLLWALAGPTPAYLAGLFTYWRRPEHAAVRWLLVLGVMFGLTTLCEYWIRLTVTDGAPWLWLPAAGMVTTEVATSAAIVGLFGLFPVGRAERGYERAILRVVLGAVVAVPALVLTATPTVAVNPFSFPAFPAVPNPLHVPALAPLGGLALALYAWFWMAALPLVVVMLVLRYRRAEHEQRRQIRWLMLGAVLGFAGALSWAVGSPWLNAILGIPGVLAVLACLVIALLDAGLLDVDLLIRRSLVYGILWSLIALGYVGAAAALGVAASSQLPVGAAILLAIAAAVLFQPARTRLERLAERRVFGERVSHYEVVTRFGDALEEAGDLDDLPARLAETVRRGLGLRWARVRLDPLQGHPELRLPQGRAGEGGDPELVVALTHADEPVGAIECGPKHEGPFTDADHRLLATLARQAAAVTHNLRLRTEQAGHLAEIRSRTAELTASRARVVQVQDAERRRLQRDLHDGVQQSVAALSLRIGLARNQLGRADERAASTLVELQADVVRLLDDLRDLAHSIRPAVLSDRGLLEAVEAQAARLPVPVVIDASQDLRGVRFPAGIEDAAWYGIAEAMTNALKHADAARIVVGLARRNGHLDVEVRDDGRGFDPEPAAGFGLVALADRMAVLGGLLTIDSAPGAGARLRMHIPLGGGQ